MTLTAAEKEKAAIARYTQEEKDVLFALFKEYEEVIDIKQRKKSRRKTMEVRQCWQEILNSYNDDPRITTRRNLKQLQKFWLNARLRKRFPFSGRRNSPTQSTIVQKDVYTISTSTPEPQLRPINPSLPSNRVKYEIQFVDSTISPGNLPGKDPNKHESQISIETLSTDNLSLNDLLEFKTENQTTEIMQIQAISDNNNEDQDIHNEDVDGDDMEEDGPGDNQVFYENEVSEDENEENLSVPHRQEDIPKGSQQLHHEIGTNTNLPSEQIVMRQPLDEGIKVFRIREAEFKCKEQQLRYEKQKVELAKSEEELRYMKEMHHLQLEEMRIKLKLLKDSGGQSK